MNESVHAGASGERSLAAIISEVREEVKSFLSTRLEMIKTEFDQAMGALKVAVPLALLALGLIGVGFLLLSLAVVALVALAFAGSPYAWFFAFLIVGAVWIVGAAAAAFFAYKEFQARGQFPKRSVEVLKADKTWLQAELRSEL